MCNCAACSSTNYPQADGTGISNFYYTIFPNPHPHDHHEDHCQHEIAYCPQCDVAYCKKCRREWGGAYTSPWPSPWYTLNGTTITCNNHE